MAKRIAKIRLDERLVKQGLAQSKERARPLIMAGEILVNGQVVYKSDTMVTDSHYVELKEKFPFASRGALKIEKAFKDFAIDVEGRNTLDVGISTGGFSDYMLKNGALRVTGVDVNIKQVDYQLRQNDRLKLIETNARTLQAEQIDYDPDVITIDVSFISVTKILPALSAFKNAKIIALIKPQFEAKRENVGKGGVITDSRKRQEVLMDLKQRITDLNYGIMGVTLAGVKGRKGNQEYFFLLEYGKKSTINDKIVSDASKTEL
jgi:23S rRNA (cytidine1920-2'-O)/16S rRNA (cytidine1409-2'-O)-methyltransferase